MKKFIFNVSGQIAASVSFTTEIEADTKEDAYIKFQNFYSKQYIFEQLLWQLEFDCKNKNLLKIKDVSVFNKENYKMDSVKDLSYFAFLKD